MKPLQTREKLLAGSLAAVIVFWLGAPWFDRNFLQPLRDAQLAVDDARAAQVAAEDAEVKIIQDKGRLDRWKGMSLPRDRDVAMRVYQEWLTDLTEVSGWPNVKVTPGRPARKGDTYFTIPVTLEAAVTWEQLGRFSELFSQMHRMHRISRLDITSRSLGGGSTVDVILTAEGLALNEGPKSNQLVPETNLDEALSLDATSVTVTDLIGFPEKTPFLARIGAELTKVTAIDGNTLTVERGLWGTPKRSHDAGDELQLLPTGPDESDVPATLEQFASAIYFSKPVPKKSYVAKLVTGTPPQPYFNQDWTHAIKVDGWNPDWDEAVFVLQGDIPEGLEINSATGQMYWRPASASEPQKFEVEIAAMSIWDEQPKVTAKINLSAMRANLPPIADIPAALPVFFGRPAEFVLTATNPEGETDRLTYRLDGQLPQGATFDSSTAIFRWNAPVDGVPQEIDLQYTVTDNGMPPASTTRAIKLTLGDDNAYYTRLEGIFAINDERWAFFRDMTVGQQKKVQVGDTITYADVKATIEEIGLNYVVLDQGEQRWQISPGKTLRQLDPAPPKPVAPGAELPPAVPQPETLPAGDAATNS